MLLEVASKAEVQLGAFRQKYQQFRKQPCQSVQSSAATRVVFTQEKPVLLKQRALCAWYLPDFMKVKLYPASLS